MSGFGVGMMPGCNVLWDSFRSWDDETLMSWRSSLRQEIRMEQQRAENGGGIYGGRMEVGGGRPVAIILVA